MSERSLTSPSTARQPARDAVPDASGSVQQAVGDEVAQPRQGLGADLVGLPLEQRGDGVSACRAVSSPSATPRYAASTVSARTTRPSPPPWRTRMTLGSSAPGRACRSSVTSEAQDHATSRRSSSLCSASQVRACRPASTVGPIGAATTPPASSSERHVGRSTSGRCIVTTPKPMEATPRAAKSASHAAYIVEWSALPGSEPPSRDHSSAYSAGSWDSRCTTHASRATPSRACSSSHSDQTSRQVRPSGTSQLPRNWATPPGSSTVPT